MRPLRWIVAVVGLGLGACSTPTAPRAASEVPDCSNTRRPCDQVLPETTDRLSTPFLAGPGTVVAGGSVTRR